MKILVAPLNWGLGHASRCIPLVRQWLEEGHEVVLAGDGDSLTLMRKHYPTLRYAYLAPLTIRYSTGKRQVWAIAKALPRLIRWSLLDHRMLQILLDEEPFDRVVSDNRFGLFTTRSAKRKKHTQTIYMTHQLHIRLPEGWRRAEGIAERIHARIWRRFDRVWVPDLADERHSLSGWLGHGVKDERIEYIGPLSRFGEEEQKCRGHAESAQRLEEQKNVYAAVAVLSGVEPQRSQLEADIVARYSASDRPVLVVQGLVGRPMTRIKRGNITIVPYLDDRALADALSHAERIIARSGYSTIMDLEALGVLQKAELIPTPGQSEQEYLAGWLKQRLTTNN